MEAIHQDLDHNILAVDQVKVSTVSACLDKFHQFQLGSSSEVDKVLNCYGATTTSLDPCLPWLLKAARLITTEWATSITSASLFEGQVPQSLKETVIKPILKKK